MITLQPFQYQCSPSLSDIRRKSRWREIISPVRNHPQPEHPPPFSLNTFLQLHPFLHSWLPSFVYSQWVRLPSHVFPFSFVCVVLKLPVLYFSVVNSQFSNSEFRIDTSVRSDHTWLVLRRMLATSTSSQVTTLLGATGFCPSSTTAGLAIW